MPTIGSSSSNPTFGQTSSGSNDQVGCGPYTMPSPGGYIQTIHAYAATFAGSITPKVVLWNSSPNVLGSANAGASIGTTPSWVSGTLAGNGIYVAAGAGVVLGWTSSQAVGANIFFNNTTPGGWWNSVASPPASLVGAPQFSHQAGAYADYVAVNAPTLASASPNHGIPGDVITLTGTGFTFATGVTFNGATASFTVVNDTTITATIPPGGTSGNLTVTNPTGSASLPFTVSALFAFDGAQLQRCNLFAHDGTGLVLVTLDAFDGTTLQEIS